MRGWLLAALVLSLSAPSAGDDFNADSAGLSASARSTATQIGQRRAAASAAPSGLTAQDAIATLKDAGLDIRKLFDAGWKPETAQELARAIRAGSEAVGRLHEEHDSAVADAYRDSVIRGFTGTLTNIEDSAKLVLGKGNLDRGCLSHQSVTYGALLGAKLQGLDARKLMIGKVMEHHAVVVTPRGLDWRKAGVVLDGWPLQSARPSEMVFPYAAWKHKFEALDLIASPRLEN